jgi:hypothetical protein
MLDPNERQTYINSLRPPHGYVFDRAIATTYSLNLLTLLTIPLSFAKFEIKKKDDILDNPVTVLEALRRISGRIHIFCQCGAIKAPPSPNPLFQYLERVLHEVSPSNPHGVFHPKMWLLRFVHEKDHSICYRFLCLSRNITFDKSWDTSLSLEGEVRARFYKRNRPLSEFIRYLPSMAKHSIPKDVSQDLIRVAEEIRHVDFQLPPNYEDLAFWPLGIPGSKKVPSFQNSRRLLVISPFLTDEFLRGLGDENTERVLISRSEELDALDPEALKRFKEIYVLDEVASDEGESEIAISTEAAVRSPLDDDYDLTGLHAKLYLAELGWNANLWTGSANATNAAFGRRNVEFLVELAGKRSRIGIDRLFNHTDGVTSFFDLLIPYTPPEKPPKENKVQKALQVTLEGLQRKLAHSPLNVKVLPTDEKDIFELLMIVGEPIDYEGDFKIDLSLWPISLKQKSAVSFSLGEQIPEIRFSNIPLEQITGLFAFALSGKAQSYKQEIRFVLNLPVKGIPENRDEKILQTLISNQENFIRYLLLLLYEGEYSAFALDMEKRLTGIGRGGQRWVLMDDMPLFEELLRAYSRDPDKIKRIATLIKDIRKTEGGQRLLPDAFMLLWQTFQEAVRRQ